MTLKKLLLGSSAVMFAAGAGISTAQAADPNPAGLVVTTMANYVEQCNNGNGWKKKDWCITLAGSIVFESSVGRTISYGSDPWNSSLTAVGTDFTILGQPVSYFGLTPTLTLTVSKPTDAGNLTLVYDIVGDSATSLTVGPWQFTSTSVRYRNTLGPATVTVTLAEPGRLGWRDPRAPSSEQYGPLWTGPWPDFAVDVNVDVGAAEVTAGFNIGERTNDIDADDIRDGFVFATVGGYVQAAFSAGPADATVRFDWDRVNAQGDGTQMPIFAWGIMATADIDVGPITITPSVGYSRNYGYYGYKYTEHEVGAYFMAGLAMTADVGENLTVNAGATYTRGPDAPADAVLEITGGVTFRPAGASPLYVTLDATYANQFGGDDLEALRLRLRVGAAF